MINEAHAANYLSRQSLEDLQTTSGSYSGHDTLLLAATQGAVPSSGPASRTLRSSRKRTEDPEDTRSLEELKRWESTM